MSSLGKRTLSSVMIDISKLPVCKERSHINVNRQFYFFEPVCIIKGTGNLVWIYGQLIILHHITTI